MKLPMKEVYVLKLHNIYYLCKNLFDILNAVTFDTHEINRSYYINNWLKYVDALNAIYQIPMFKKTSEQIYECIPVFVRKQNRPIVDADTKNNFNRLNNSVLAQMKTIINLYESMEINNDGDGIDVKIPVCKDLDEYIYYLKELNFIFTQCPYLLCKDEKIQFSNVDVGSNWLSFLIELSAGSAMTCYILTNLAKILGKVLVLKSHYQSIKEQEEALKIAKKKTELLDEEKEIFTTLKKYYMNDAIDKLEEEIEPLKNGEEKGKVEKSLEKLTNLLDKGVEIYASLDTPKDVQVLFPEISETKKLPDNVLKLLEDNTSQKEDK